MKITLIGCGGWGERLARALARMGLADRLVLVDEIRERVAPLAGELDCAWTSDPYGYLGVTGTQSNSVEGGAVIVATPPEERLQIIRAVLDGYGKPPMLLRVEKPLAMNVDDAERIVGWCENLSVELTTGFTLLHHPLYDAAFKWLDEQGASVTHLTAARIGARPRHRCDALIDAGIHAASIAAHAECDATITARFGIGAFARSRWTILETLAHGSVIVDELDGFVETIDGRLTVPAYDALEADLAAWVGGTHRGKPQVALAAQRIIDRHLAEVAAA